LVAVAKYGAPLYGIVGRIGSRQLYDS